MEMQAPPGRPAVPWTAAEVGLALLLSLAVEVLVHQLLSLSGWFDWFYGREWVEAARAAAADDDAGRLARARMALWVPAVALPLKVAAVVALLWRTAGVSLAQLGLTTRRLGRGALLGLLLALALTPGAYGINALMILLIEEMGGRQQPHVFMQIGQAGLSPAEWGVLVFSAVVAAPLWEELFYRGVVQPWVIDRQPAGGWAALAVALAVTASVRGEAFVCGVPPAVEWLPFVLLIALAAAYPLLAGRSAATAGVYASGVLFAWVHVAVWPSPVPLVWLAMGLGWLFYRTGSLAGPIVLHAAFNAVPCVMLLWEAARK